MTPSELIAHAIPRLLEEQGLRPRAPAGDEVLVEGERAGDPLWLLFTPLPRDAAGCARARESLAARFRPGDPPTRGLGLLVFLRAEGALPDLAALDALPTPQGTRPLLRAVCVDLADGRISGDVSRIRPLAAIARTLERSGRAACAGEKPPDLRRVAEGQLNLAKAYRARRPWATWALTAAVFAVYLLQHQVDGLKAWRAGSLSGSAPHLVVANALCLPAPRAPSLQDLLVLVFTVISLLALGTLLERLYGWKAILALWFACAAGSAWIARREAWVILPGPEAAIFGVMGAEVALALGRRAVPWPFRKGLLAVSFPFICVSVVLVVVAQREAANEVLAAGAIGATLAAVLPLRPPLSARGGPLFVRLLLLAMVAVCALALGKSVADLVPRPARYESPDGWSVVAPIGYRIHPAEGAGVRIEGPELHVSVQAGGEARRREDVREEWRKDGMHIDLDEEVASGGARWGHLRCHDENDEVDLYLAEIGGRPVEVRATGRLGSMARHGAEVRAIVESVRLGPR